MCVYERERSLLAPNRSLFPLSTKVLDRMGIKDSGLDVGSNLLVLLGLWLGLAVIAFVLLERRSSARERRRSKLLS